MTATRIIALVLIIAGSLGLAYGGFSYTRESHDTNIGPIQLTVRDRERVNVPVWLGAGAVLLGVVLLIARPKG